MNVASVRSVSWKRSLPFFLVAVIVLIADRVSKALVMSNMTPGQSIPAEGRFRLSYTTNSGAIFGLDINSTFLMIMAFVVVGLIIWIYVQYLTRGGKLLRLGLGLVLGGALGNLIDRVRFGEVTDFIDVRLWGDFHWATFNIADASLTVGIIILVYCLLVMARATEQAGSS